MPQLSQRGWRPLKGHLSLLVSGGLVLVIGALGLVAGQDVGDRARDVHRADRVDLQRTLAGLVGQYTQVSAAEVLDLLAVQEPWSAAAGDPATTGRLKALVDQTRALDAGAVLTSPLGVPLASYSVTDDLPAATDPGWSPLRRAVLAGDGSLPLSGVLTSSRAPHLAMGLPVRLSDGTRGLLIGLSTARGGALQQYVSTLSYGDTGHGYVVDGAGVVVAGPDRGDVGRPLGRERLRSALLAGSRGLLETDDGRPLLTSVEPAGQTGWLSLLAQDKEEFEGALDRASRLVQVAVVALLLIAGTGLVVVHRKRESALEEVALQDELTGVLNRRGWSVLAEHELQRARR